MPIVQFSSRPMAIVIAGVAINATAMTASNRSGAEPRATAGNIIEFLTYVRGSQGVVLCGLFEQQGWLKKTVQPSRARIVGGRALCVFRDVAPGTYGISAFHDANDNGKLDTNFLGMPMEDYCASRNARGVMGPPSFADAKFVYKGDILRLAVSMK